MNSHPLTLEEELSIRTHADEVWQMTWGKASNLDAKKAFTEGFCMAFTMGILAVRQQQKAVGGGENNQNVIIGLLIVLVTLALCLGQ